MLPSNARPSQAQIMTANFVAGTVGGGLAAAVTTPLDVVKTRLQVPHHPLLLTSPCLGAVHARQQAIDWPFLPTGIQPGAF